MKKRIKFIDYAKGIGILLVILGHAELNGLPKIWLYSFHMPLFFFMTGIVTKIDLNDIKTFVRKRVYSLMIPFFCFSVILLIKDLILILGFSKEFNIFVEDFLGMILQIRTTTYAGSFWFLPVIFEAILILVIAEWLSFKLKKTWFIYLFAGICFLSGYLIITFIETPLLFNFDAALIAASFIIMGKTMGSSFIKYDEEIKLKHKLYIIFIAFFINLIVGNINSGIIGNASDLYWSRLGNPVYYLIAAYSGIILIIFFSMLIPKNNFLIFAGQNSLLFYTLHHEFLFPVVRKILSLVNMGIYYPYLLTIITSILLIPICIFINKYLSILAGKYYK